MSRYIKYKINKMALAETSNGKFPYYGGGSSSLRLRDLVFAKVI